MSACERRDAPEDPLPALLDAPDGLVTQEVAAIMARGNDAPDPVAAEAALIELVGAGDARRVAVGDGALWQAVRVGMPRGGAGGAAGRAAVAVG